MINTYRNKKWSILVGLNYQAPKYMQRKHNLSPFQIPGKRLICAKNQEAEVFFNVAGFFLLT